jgi:glucose 1-dehydrogenase
MSKGAVSQLVGVMANELACHRINVNIINPGWIDTPTEHTLRGEEELQRVARRIPWGRLGTAREVGRCAVFLASEDAEYITGASIRVDGGFKVVMTLPEPK